MKHLEAAFNGKNSAWRYIVLIFMVFLAANSIGAIPMIAGLAVRSVSDPEALGRVAANNNDLGALGFDPNITLIMLLFPSLAGLIAFILLIKPLNSRTIFQTINGGSSIRWKRIFISGTVWIVFSAIYLAAYKGLDPSNFRLNNTSVSLVYLILISLLLIPFQASLEEVIFRGYLMQGLAILSRNRWAPVIITSVLFGILHAWNPEIKEFGFFTMMPQYVMFGLLFGIITVLDDGIEIAMGAHIANNAFLSITVTNSSSILQTPAVYEQLHIEPWLEFAALVLTAIAFFFVMKHIFEWNKPGILIQKVEPAVVEQIQTE
jgi:membrane protease YdiL (CAAX protease family)